MEFLTPPIFQFFHYTPVFQPFEVQRPVDNEEGKIIGVRKSMKGRASSYGGEVQYHFARVCVIWK